MLNLLAAGRGRADKLKVSKVFYVSLDTPAALVLNWLTWLRDKETGWGHGGSTRVLPS